MTYAALAAVWVVFSDRLIGLMAVDQDSLLRLGTAKGLLFVGLTSVLLYSVLKRRARGQDGGPAPRGGDFVAAALASLIFLVALSGFGWAVYQSAKRSVTGGVHDQLAAIARLKAGQIQTWLEKCREDVDVMVDTPLLGGEIQSWIAGGRRDDVHRERIVARLQQLAATPRYRTASLYSPDTGAPMISTAADPDSPRLRALARHAAHNGGPVLEESEGAADRTAIAVDLFGTIHASGDRSRPVAVLRLVIEPADLLAPLLSDWPGADASAETILLRRDGDGVMLVSSSRYRTGARDRLRLALGDAGTLAAQVVAGRSGAITGYDRRGAAVLAYALPIAGTPWYVITKVDEADAYATLDSLTVAAWVMLAILFLASLWWWWERHRESLLRQRDQLDRAVLAKRLDYLARYTSDGVMMLDVDGMITDVNSRCLAQHGYERAELIGKSIAELANEPGHDRLATLLRRVREEGSLTYETEHRRKDGSLFPVEVAVRAIDLEGERSIQLICRDISPRIQAERAIREREDLFNEFFHASPAGMFMLDRELRYLRVNAPLARMHGVPADAHGGRSVAEVLPRLAPALEPMFRGVLEQGELVLTTEVSGETPRLPGVTQHWIMALFRIAASGDKPAALGGVVVDISPRKRAEARILALSRLYATISATNQAIVRGGSLGEVFAAVCRACVSHGGFSLAWVGLADGERAAIVPTEAFGDAVGYLDGLLVSTRADVPEGRGPTGAAYREARVSVCNEFLTAPETAPWHERAARHGLRAAIALPLRCNGAVTGALTVYGAEKNIFHEEAVGLLSEMADNISFAMDQFERERRRRQAEAALRQSETRLREAQSVGRIGSWEIDLATWELTGSEELFRMYERHPASGTPDYDEILSHYLPASAERTREGIRRAITRGERVELEQQVRLPSGRMVFHGVVIVPERNASGWTTKLRGTVQDITERKLAEQAVAKYAAEVEDLYQHAPCGYHSLDADGHFCLINDTELKWLGYEREELIGRVALADLVAPEHRAIYEADFVRLKSAGSLRDSEFELVRKDGSRLPILLNATAVLDAQGHFVVSRSTVFDMTERKKMERERAEHALRLAEMSRNLVAVQEEERRRLAGLLHDRTSPNLAAIQINLGIVASGLEGDLPEELDARLDDTLALLEDTTFGIREICTELRPALLDYAGLGAALESFAQNFARRTGVAVHVDVDPCARLAADVESTLFRIVQEAVTNCAKHAEARTLEIKLAAADGATVLTIADDGVGFDPGELGREGKAPGLGLLTMRERAEFAGGRFSIQSRPGGGALVRVEIGRRDPECVGAEA